MEGTRLPAFASPVPPWLMCQRRTAARWDFPLLEGTAAHPLHPCFLHGRPIGISKERSCAIRIGDGLGGADGFHEFALKQITR